MYHDVLEPGTECVSGFAAAKMLYKIEIASFRQHLVEIARRTRPGVIAAIDCATACCLPGKHVCLTFDDGGVSAMTAARILDEHGWKGHFFIATDWIGRSGFLEAKQIRELSRAGHLIGSHSCSHPERMSYLDPKTLLEEWTKSLQRLAEIVQGPVRTASVPNGYYSRRVALAASMAGIEVLFTSEPTPRLKRVDQCVVVGRYTVHRGLSAASVARIAVGVSVSCWGQSCVWQLKKVAKKLGGEYYLRFRDRVLTP